MLAAVYSGFRDSVRVDEVPDPEPAPHSAVIEVEACGICRSDWHGWMGHDPDIALPHVPGHELAGTVAAVGGDVHCWKPGDRVTVPFCCGCGACEQCRMGRENICDRYSQPGFTQWGAFAEYVDISHADVNLVALPDSIDSVTAASLGCRFATSFRAIVDQAGVTSEDTVVVYGCGGVGLSAVMISAAFGARVIAVDLDQGRLDLARRCGAADVIKAGQDQHTVDRVIELTSGGATVSVDAYGSQGTCYNAISSLAKRGRHVQIGLTLGDESDPRIPMSLVVARELELVGSHGLAPQGYRKMLDMVMGGQLHPQLLLGELVTLRQACEILPNLDRFPGRGIYVINRFADY